MAQKPFQGQAKKSNIIIIGQLNAAEMKILEKLPDKSKIIASGDQEKDFQNVQLSDINVLLFAWGPSQKFVVQTLKTIWPKLVNLEWMHSVAAGVNGILTIQEIVKSDVVLTNCKGVYNHSLAEYSITACTWFAKRLETMRQNQKKSQWTPIVIEELRGKTFGVIGYGDIGRRCCEIARAYKMRIVALKRNPQDAQKDIDNGLLDKVYGGNEACQMVSECDYVVTVLPQTPKTIKFVNKEIVSSMKATAILINIGRGTTVDEGALIEALQQNKIGGAALDVTEIEPLPSESPLYQLENVLLSPHCADLTTHMMLDSVNQFVTFVNYFQQGQGLINVVDKEQGY